MAVAIALPSIWKTRASAMLRLSGDPTTSLEFASASNKVSGFFPPLTSNSCFELLEFEALFDFHDFGVSLISVLLLFLWFMLELDSSCFALLSTPQSMMISGFIIKSDFDIFGNPFWFTASILFCSIFLLHLYIHSCIYIHTIDCYPISIDVDIYLYVRSCIICTRLGHVVVVLLWILYMG